MQTSILSPRLVRSFARPENRSSHCGHRGNQQIAQNNRTPLNVMETDDSFLMQVAAPGFSKDEVTVTEKENILTVVMNHTEEVKSNFTHREFGSQEESIAIRLPKNLDLDTLVATVHNGVISIAVAKKSEAKPKIITVQ